METIVSQTVAALRTLPQEAKRQIAVSLLDSEAAPELPVIEFTDPALDRA